MASSTATGPMAARVLAARSTWACVVTRCPVAWADQKLLKPLSSTPRRRRTYRASPSEATRLTTSSMPTAAVSTSAPFSRRPVPKRASLKGGPTPPKSRKDPSIEGLFWSSSLKSWVPGADEVRTSEFHGPCRSCPCQSSFRSSGGGRQAPPRLPSPTLNSRSRTSPSARRYRPARRAGGADQERRSRPGAARAQARGRASGRDDDSRRRA